MESQDRYYRVRKTGEVGKFIDYVANDMGFYILEINGVMDEYYGGDVIACNVKGEDIHRVIKKQTVTRENVGAEMDRAVATFKKLINMVEEVKQTITDYEKAASNEKLSKGENRSQRSEDSR